MIGAVLEERYRILQKLGEGTFGEVYLAEHLHLGRKEALKVLRPDVASTPEFVARFRREARAMNRLQHPCIVRVYDFGRLPDGRLFLSMEYAEGESLARLVARTGPLSVPLALHVLLQLTEAVGHAHACDVVHRDLVPANLILVEHRGVGDLLKVLDFGIAKILAGDATESMALTKTGQILGTPAYMSPEQIRGRPADPRSDLYSIGCIAFELLTGAPPFLLPTTPELMHAHLIKAPDRPSARRSGIPEALDSLVLRCLEKTPERRHATALELRDALRVISDSLGRAALRQTSVGATPAGDFESLDTQEMPGGHADPALAGGGETQPVLSADDARRALRQVMRELGRTLSELTPDAAHLALPLVRIQELEIAIGGCEQAMAELAQRAGELEQDEREREAAARFTLSDLRFERDQAATPDLDARIAELEQRVADMNGELEVELALLSEQSLAWATDRAKLDDAIDAAYAEMRPTLEELAPRFEQNPTVLRLDEAQRVFREIIED